MVNVIVSSIPDFNVTDLKLKGFKVYEIQSGMSPIPAYVRRDFFKVCLVTGKTHIQYADREYEMDGTFLMFANPHIPYSSKNLSAEQSGYACLFSEEFLKLNDRSESLQDSFIFKIGGMPVVYLDDMQKEFVSIIFKKMLAEQSEDYVFRDNLIRSSLHLIIHEAQKMQPPAKAIQHKNASSRIASVFLALLERQFPVDNPNTPLKLKTANDYAESLAVHVNHLNRSVREVTGKSTTAHITDRVITEAKALLQHTDWSIAEIAYGLGFEYPTYFNNYFKKITGATPRSFR
jgi:AraC family transcriptional activator of pobA